MTQTLLATCGLLLCCTEATPQQVAAAFSVASVKPAEISRFMGTSLSPKLSPGSFRCVCSLQTMVMWAYGFKRDQVVFPVGLKDADIYEVYATYPETSLSDVPAMLRVLLADRFHLAVRRQSRLTSIYAMTVDKGGLKLKRSAGPSSIEDAIRNPPHSFARATFGGRADRLKVEGSGTLDEIAGAIKLDRPVINKTGTSGRFDYVIDATLPTRGSPFVDSNETNLASSAAEPGAGDTASIFMEIRKLGLRLIPEKVMTDYLVVVHVDTTPTEN